MRILLLIIVLAVRNCPAGEPSKTWSDWFSEGKALFASGNYSAAARAFREALGIAVHSDVTDRQLVELHDALAGVYAAAGQFAESEGEYRCALALVPSENFGRCAAESAASVEFTTGPRISTN